MDELHEFVDMVFDKEATAKAYVEKLYRFFVKSEWSSADETNIINPLTQLLIDNDYEIMPVVRTILSSQHFYDAGDSDPSDEILGSIIKSPLQLLSSAIRNLGFVIPVSYTHLRAHETPEHLVCRLLLEKKKYCKTR